MTLTVECSSDLRASQVADARSTVHPARQNGAATVALLLVAAGLFAALCAPALCGLVYTADDLGAFHLPLRDFYARALENRDAFDWCGQLFGGFYLTGEGQAGTYHPFHWLIYRFLPLPVAWNVECLASYPFMFAGMWLLLRRRGFVTAAALFGSIAFTFCGFNLLRFVHVNAISVIAHVPWQLWAIDRLRSSYAQRDRSTCYGNVARVAALTGSQLLLGYPQYVLYSLIAELLYLAVALGGPGSASPPRPWQLVAAWLAGKTIGVLLGAVQLVATLVALADSVRQTADASFSATGSLHPLNFIQLVAPYLFATRVVGQNTHELTCYVGVVPLLLAVFAISNRRVLRVSWTTVSLWRFALLIIGVGVLIALGSYGPIQPLVDNLPLFGSMRFPCRGMVLVHVGTSILAALGFWQIAEVGRTDTAADTVVRTPRAAMGLLVAASMLAAIGGKRAWPDYTASVWLVGCGPVLMVVGALLVSRAARGCRLALVATVVFFGVDLGIYGLSYAVYRQAARLNDYIAKTSPGLATDKARLAVDLAQPNADGLRIGNQALLAGFSRIDGYAGLQPARTLDYRDAKALRLAGVQFVATSAPIYNSSQLNRHDQDWLSLSNPLPRARLVTLFRATDSARLTLSSLDLTEEVMVEACDAAAVAEHLHNDAGADPSDPHAEILIDRPGYIVVECQTAKRAILALTESYHQGWTVQTDTAVASPLRLNGDFLGCLVAAGRSTVTFRFAPASLWYGRLASLCGLSLLVVLVGAGWPRFYRPQGL